MPTLIVGGGLAGLAAALELDSQNEPFVLCEQAGRVGGVVGSRVQDGFLLEQGPRTVAGNASVLKRLIDAAGLADSVLSSNETAQRRYIWSQGRLHCVPHSPAALLTTGLMSLGGRLRFLVEPLIRRGGHDQETLAAFVTRRFGAEAALRLADPMCAGVFGGRAEDLGVDAFARAAELEQQHGSVMVGMGKTARERRARGEPMHTLLSFPGGLQELTDALAARFSQQILLDTSVTALRRTDDGFEASLDGPEGRSSLAAQRVVVAVPAPTAASMLSELEPGAAVTLASIRQAPIAIVALGFSRDSVAHPLDGFGLLCCSDSPVPTDRPVLGVLFSSSIFEGRAPAGSVLLEVMIGGDRDPAALGGSDEELLTRASDACKELLGSSGAPSFHAITRWPPVLPQYPPGHAALITELEQAVSAIGPIALAGNYLRGVGVEGAAASGMAAARSLLAQSRQASVS